MTISKNPCDLGNIVSLSHGFVWIKLLYLGTYDIESGDLIAAIDLAMQQKKITIEDLRTRRLVFDTLCEGHGHDEIRSALMSLRDQSWFDHARMIFLHNVFDDFSDIAKVVAWPEYMTNHCRWLDHFLDQKVNWNPLIRDKAFICIIRRRSDQRSRLIKQLRERFSPDQYHLSYASMIDYQAWDPIAELDIPVLLDGPTPGNQQHRATDKRFYQALINVIAETSNQFDSGWKTRFVTEKTFKCFAWRQIPIWWSMPGLVNDVRSLGFDVFDDIMQNHDYDFLEDPQERLEQVIVILEQAVKKIQKIGIQEYSTRIMPRLEKNWQRLLEIESLRLGHWPEIIRRVRNI